MVVQKNYVIIFLLYFFIFASQAEVKEQPFTFDSSFSLDVVSGEKKRIEHTIDNWITFLREGKNGKEFYPSSLKKKREVDQFLQLLTTANNEKTNSVLISLANLYFSSAEKIYEQIFRNSPVHPTRSFSALYDLSLFFDYSTEEQRLVVMMREWYIGLVFLSLAGFSSSDGKGLYISAIERIQIAYNFLFGIFNQVRPLSHGAYRKRFVEPSPRKSVVMNELFESVIKFNDSFSNLQDIYFKFILPAFKKLSWVKYDIQSGHPEVLFVYGRIIHRAYGSKGNGLSYISMSADRGYLPAVKYLGEHYLRQEGGTHYQVGEQLMMDYLENSSHLIEKLKVIRKLFHLNREKGDNARDSFQRGVSSLRRSCLAAFKSNRLNINNGRDIRRRF